MIHKTKALIAILYCVPIFGIGIDLYTPSLPFIAQDLATSTAWTKMTISSFMLGAFLGMLVFGTLADILGRRKLILASLVGYILFNLLIAFSPSIYLVITLRFISGICAGSIAALNRAQTTDLFRGDEMKKVSSSMTIAWGLGPILAPFIGGFLQHFLGWQAPFIFLAIYGLVGLVLMYFYLPETHKERTNKNLYVILSDYRTILSHKAFLGALLQCGILYGILLYFGIIGSFYVQSQLQYSAVTYGNFSLLLGFAYFFGTIFRRIFSHISDCNYLKITFNLLIAINIVFFIISFLSHWSMLVLLLNAFISSFIVGLIYPVYLNRCLSLFPKIAGTAGALSGAGVMLIISIISAFAGLIQVTLLPIFIAIYLITAAINYLLFLFLKPE